MLVVKTLFSGSKFVVFYTTPHQAEEHRPSTLCYNCQGMGYSKSILLYQDKPKYGLVFKLILIIPVGFLVASVYLWSSGEATGGSSLVT